MKKTYPLSLFALIAVTVLAAGCEGTHISKITREVSVANEEDQVTANEGEQVTSDSASSLTIMPFPAEGATNVPRYTDKLLATFPEEMELDPASFTKDSIFLFATYLESGGEEWAATGTKPVNIEVEFDTGTNTLSIMNGYWESSHGDPIDGSGPAEYISRRAPLSGDAQFTVLLTDRILLSGGESIRGVIKELADTGTKIDPDIISQVDNAVFVWRFTTEPEPKPPPFGPDGLPLDTE